MISSPLSRVTRRVLLATALTLGMAPFAQAERIVRIIVPFGPGAVQDTVARTFSNELGQALGATVVVENRAGAGGSVGTGQVAVGVHDHVRAGRGERTDAGEPDAARAARDQGAPSAQLRRHALHASADGRRRNEW